MITNKVDKLISTLDPSQIYCDLVDKIVSFKKCPFFYKILKSEDVEICKNCKDSWVYSCIQKKLKKLN